MNRQEYKEILGRLPIDNPKPEDMAQICPHLTEEQAVTAFNSELNYVACPSLLIQDAFQIVSIQKEWIETNKRWHNRKNFIVETITHPLQLRSLDAGRTLRSYEDGKSHGDMFYKYQYMHEAIKFAKYNWGDELILDNWQDVIEFIIQDPSDLYKKGIMMRSRPKTKARLYVCLGGEWNKLINNHSMPLSALIDEAISQMTLDKMIWRELRGGRGEYIEFNCAYCGSGLALSECRGCNHHFEDDHSRSGWNTPLSQKMVKLLQANGHIFKKDPTIAWQREKEQYQRFLKLI